MTTGYTRACEIADTITAAGVYAVTDPRNIAAPCVLVTPPEVTNDLACGWSATWRLMVLLPGGWNADAWKAADATLRTLDALFDLDRATPTTYTTGSADYAGYEATFTEAI